MLYLFTATLVLFTNGVVWYGMTWCVCVCVMIWDGVALFDVVGRFAAVWYCCPCFIMVCYGVLLMAWFGVGWDGVPRRGSRTLCSSEMALG